MISLHALYLLGEKYLHLPTEVLRYHASLSMNLEQEFVPSLSERKEGYKWRVHPDFSSGAVHGPLVYQAPDCGIINCPYIFCIYTIACQARSSLCVGGKGSRSILLARQTRNSMTKTNDYEPRARLNHTRIHKHGHQNTHAHCITALKKSVCEARARP